MENNGKKLHIQGEEIEVYPDHPIRVSCMEHVEEEIDEFVDRYEVAPDTFKVEDIEDGEIEKKCMVCGAQGQVALLRVKGM